MVCLIGACGEHDIAHIAYSFILMPARVLAFFYSAVGPIRAASSTVCGDIAAIPCFFIMPRS